MSCRTRNNTLRSAKTILCMALWIVLAVCPAWAGADDATDRTFVDPGEFFDSGRFLFFEEDARIRLNLTREQNLSDFTGVLFRLTATNKMAREFIIDWQAARPDNRVLLVNGDHAASFTLRDTTLFSNGIPTPMSLYFNFRRDSICLTLGADTLPVTGTGLSIDSGYKFTLLPALSKSSGYYGPVLKTTDVNVSVRKRSLVASVWYWLVIIIAVDLIIFIWLHLHRRYKRKKAGQLLDKSYEEADPELSFRKVELPRESSIHLFGGLQVVDSGGEDITKRFSPLLRELLAILITSSVRKGVSSDKLAEILWYDKDRSSAKNNRSVNIGKLRSLLDQLGTYELSNESGYWKFTSDDIFVDYIEFTKLVNDIKTPTKEQVERLLALTANGSLLPEDDHPWLDRYKSETSDLIIEKLWEYALTLDVERSPRLFIDLADIIFRFEHINEQALYLKVKAYSVTGRHSSAQKAYEKFRAEYESVYGEPLKVSLTELLDKEEFDGPSR